MKLQKYLVLTLLCVLSVLAVGLSTTLAADSDFMFFVDTGNLYQVIDNGETFTWEQAEAAAEALPSPADGCTSSHLIVITTQAEFNFMLNFGEALLDGKWLGASQDPIGEMTADANWFWVTGEAVAMVHVDVEGWGWGTDADGDHEPNDQPNGPVEPGSEQWMNYYAISGGWNDSANIQSSGYVAEFECDIAAPSFTAGADVTVLEDSGAYSAPWATDITSFGDPVFSVTTDNDGLFSAAPAIAADGTLSFTPASDEFGDANVTVTLTDSVTTLTSEATFVIHILPVNDPPVVVGSGDEQVLEDSGPYSAIWATTLNPGPANESDQILTITTTNDDPGLFAAQPDIAADGTLTFTPADETFGIATVTVTVQDDGGTENGGQDTTVVSFDIVVLPVNDPPDCSAAFVTPDELWPPNHKMREITIGGITDVDSTIFTFSFDPDAITSNEAVNGLGDGNTEPDWMVEDIVLESGDGSQVLWLRAERSGLGTGRIYTIVSFIVDDADFTPDLGDDFTMDDVVDGGACTNDSGLIVTVPHDRRGGPPINTAADAGMTTMSADASNLAGMLGDTLSLETMVDTMAFSSDGNDGSSSAPAAPSNNNNVQK